MQLEIHTPQTQQGGAASVTSGSTAITVAQMPAHSHGMNLRRNSGGYEGGLWRPNYPRETQYGNYSDNVTGFISSTGSGQGHTHTVDTMPPYKTVYMWERTA